MGHVSQIELGCLVVLRRSGREVRNRESEGEHCCRVCLSSEHRIVRESRKFYVRRYPSHFSGHTDVTGVITTTCDSCVLFSSRGWDWPCASERHSRARHARANQWQQIAKHLSPQL